MKWNVGFCAKTGWSVPGLLPSARMFFSLSSTFNMRICSLNVSGVFSVDPDSCWKTGMLIWHTFRTRHYKFGGRASNTFTAHITWRFIGWVSFNTHKHIWIDYIKWWKMDWLLLLCVLLARRGSLFIVVRLTIIISVLAHYNFPLSLSLTFHCFHFNG